jgi:hypothetical protein
MAREDTPSAVWASLDSKRSGRMKAWEEASELTIASLLRGDRAEDETDYNDAQSLGAQCVNHLTNKMMLAAFSPTRPSFRIEPSKKFSTQLKQSGQDISAALSEIERGAIRELDRQPIRPKLYATFRHLITVGNCLLVDEDETLRVMSVKYYVLRRTIRGDIATLVTKERIRADELLLDVRNALVTPVNDDTMVDYYKWVRLMPDGKYEVSQWVNEQNLGPQFTSTHTKDKLPFYPQAWNLADESDWATGLVGEYINDFRTLSKVAVGLADGTVLSMEFRMLVNPAGMTSVDDLNNSRNGQAIAGTPEDVNSTSPGNGQAVSVGLTVMQHWEQRISRAFLLASAVTRNAERVTAEEIRATAQELEQALGGVYSSLAHTLQTPVAYWLLSRAGTDVQGTQLDVVVVTGLDALSRMGDVDRIRQAFGVLAELSNAPPQLQQRMKFDTLVADIGAGMGVDLSKYVMTDGEYSQELAAQGAARVAESGATADATQPAQ